MKRIIIFDWDDTLFPSTYLSINNIVSKECINNFERDYIEILSKDVVSLLEKLLEKYPVYILTNAEYSWIRHCIDRWYNPLSTIIDKISVVSARDNYKNKHESSSHWKYLSMNDIFTFEGEYDSLEVISIGDSEDERSAIRKHYDENKIKYKSIKLTYRPDLEILHTQIISLKEMIDSILNIDKDLDLHIKIHEN